MYLKKNIFAITKKDDILTTTSNTKKQNPRFFIIDTFAFIFRSYYAIRNIDNNAVYGFTSTLKKLIETEKPDYIVAAFDSPSPTFRKEIFPEYKANRPAPPEDLIPQIPLIKEVLAAFRIPVIEKGGFESDDIIGTLAKKLSPLDIQTVIVTGDKDMLQLVEGEHVVYYDPSKDTGLISEEGVPAYFGCTRDQIVDLLMIWGDSSDNIPGVPGIGEKGAKKLLGEYGSLEKIYENLENITRKSHREGLEKARSQMELTRELVTIRRDVPIDFDMDACRIEPINARAAQELFQKLNFRTFLKDLPIELDTRQVEHQLITESKGLDSLVSQLKEKKFFVFDVETNGLDPLSATLVGISFALEKSVAYYIALAHEEEECLWQEEIEGQNDAWREEVKTKLQPIFENPEIGKVAHNLKFDLGIIEEMGWKIKGPLEDTILMSYLLFPNDNRHGLDFLAEKFLQYKMVSFEEVCGSGKEQIPFSQVDMQVACQYSAEDSDICWQIHEKLTPKMKEWELNEVYQKVEVPLVRVLSKMERRGFRIDLSSLQKMSDEMEGILQKLEEEIYELAGETFNINSSQQLGQIMFEKLGLPSQKKTSKTKAYSTSHEVLEKLAGKGHKLPEKLLDYRSVSKLKSTYVDSLPTLVSSQTGRVHSNFNQVVAATGRLSSNNPNLQNIPIRTPMGRKIRSAFIPKEDWTLVVADYSQVELRIMAHLSQDKTLVESFQKGEDIHRRTASEIFDVPLDMVPDEMRRAAKAINFGLIYGMGDFRLAQELKIPRKEARKYIEAYFQKIPGVQEFSEKIIEQAKKDGYVRTHFGRLRQIPEINSRNKNLQNQGARLAVNTVIQGSAADLIKLAMIRLDKALDENNLQSCLLLQVHDELVLESPSTEIEQVSSLLRSSMEGVVNWSVPLVAEVETGQNWEDAK